MDKLTKKKLLIISLGLLIINFLLTFALFKLDSSAYKHLDGKEIEAHSSELIQTVVFGQIISVPMLSFLIGLIVAVFIDKSLPYSKKIIRGFLLTLVAIYGLFMIMGIFKIISFL